MSNALSHVISVETVKELLLEKNHDVLLLDCRRQDEYEFVHLESARWIPMDEIQARLSELEEFREKRIIVYCHHGGRSESVTRWLRTQGFSSVQSMTGGIDLWAVTIDTSLPRY